MTRQPLLSIAAALGGLLLAMALWPLYEEESGPEPLPTTATDIALPDLAGEPRHLREWRGQVVLINFWASWCAPCREEIPMLVRLQDEYGPEGFTVIGIAVDSASAIADLARVLDINYPVLIADMQGIEHSRTLGNARGVLPYSVVLDRQGQIVLRQEGILREERLLETITPLL